MPVIVLEGPDQSGKTTLARMLYHQLSPISDIQVEYQRSPVKTLGWSDGYNSYLVDLLDVTSHRLVIQDRIPEISETVYGNAVRGHSRGLGWARELPHWMHNDTFFIFCLGTPWALEREEDASGNHIGTEEHHTILTMYEDIHHQMSRLPLSPMQVVAYNRMRAGSWLYICSALSGWLTRIFPRMGDEFLRLNFAWDSKFPMPEEMVDD